MNINIALIGDIALNDHISETLDENEKRYSEIGKLLKNIDFVFCNLEFPVLNAPPTNEDTNRNKSVYRYCLYGAAKTILPLLNVSAVSLANNHIFDYGSNGLMETIRILKNLNIKYSGAGCFREGLNPVILEKKQIKIAFLSYVDASTHPKHPENENCFLNLLSEERVITDIKSVRELADMTVVSLHWGRDYSRFPLDTQKKMAYRFIDEGADLIMGHHPHTMQLFEKYNDKYIFYSLGSLTFGDFILKSRRHSLLYKTKFSFIPIIDQNNNIIRILSTKEKRGNYIQVTDRHILAWNNRYNRIAALRGKNKMFQIYWHYRELYLDRVYNFFFGYYRKPFQDLFLLSSWKKLIRLVRHSNS
jgi:hypothetical protein